MNAYNEEAGATCRMANEEGLQRDCMRVLNRCIQQLEADVERSRIVGAAVQSVMDTLLNKVTLLVSQ